MDWKRKVRHQNHGQSGDYTPDCFLYFFLSYNEDEDQTKQGLDPTIGDLGSENNRSLSRSDKLAYESEV